MAAYWLGNFVNTGSQVLFDPACQIDGSPYVLLFVFRTGEYRVFPKTKVRPMLVAVQGPNRRKSLIAQYECSRIADVLSQQMERAMAQLADDTEHGTAELRDRHQRHLRSLGKTGEAKITTPRRLRSAHCYACKDPLSTEANLECTSCGWLICACGACGCGFGSAKSTASVVPQDDDLESLEYARTDPDEGNDADYEASQIREEADDYSSSLVRSDDEGWFYSDTEPE